jgi:hypothetical protein
MRCAIHDQTSSANPPGSVPSRGRRQTLRAKAGAGAACLAGCVPKWAPSFSNEGWFNNIHSRCITPARSLRPRSLAEVVQYVQEAEQAHARIRAVGGGHSFSDVAFADGWLLRTLDLDRPFPLRPSRLTTAARNKRLFQVEAGIRLRTLNGLLDIRGLALPNMGGWDLQTLAGVVSTSTHGSGLDYGPFPSFVRSMIMVTAGGMVLQFEPQNGITDPQAFEGVVDTPCGPYPAELVQNDDAFRAVLVNMGCMGVIYSIVIEVVPSFWLHEEREVTTWESVAQPNGFLGKLLRNGTPDPGWRGVQPDFYELLVNPYPTSGTHACVITRRTKREKNNDPSCDCRKRASTLYEIVQNIGYKAPYVIPDLINDDPAHAAGKMADAMSLAKDRCYESQSYNVFNAGLINELPAYSVDIGVELSQTVAAVQSVLDKARLLQLVRLGIHDAPISVRFVGACDAYLSPQFGRPTCMIEIFALLGVPGTDAMLLGQERDLMRTFGARPHWGLDLGALESRRSIEQTYDHFGAWHERFAKYNASGVFDGEVTERLGISISKDKPWQRSHQCVPLP